MRVFGCLFVMILFTGPTAAGRDIYVDNRTGNDQYTGHRLDRLPDRSGPVKTIGKALRLARAGDRIILVKNDEPYRECLSLVGSAHGGDGTRPLVIEGNGAILDGSAPVPVEAWRHHAGAVFRFLPPQGGPQRLFLDDLPVERVVAEGPAAELPALEPLQWCSHQGHIYFCVETDKMPKDYRFTRADLQTGVTLYQVRDVTIADLTVQGFRVDGLSAANSARGVQLFGVTARGNGRSGISVGGASHVVLRGCVVGNNGEAQLLTLPYSETVVEGSWLFTNPAPAWMDRGGRVSLDGRTIEGGLLGNVEP